MPGPSVHIEPWGEDDLPLLELLNHPEMTRHLGGPESPEKVVDRQRRYVELVDPKAGRMFTIVVDATGEAVGSVGYWERTTPDGNVYETGWSVIPPFQGQGIAVAATAQVIAVARSQRSHRYLHAYPSIDNAPSNAICRKLGFTMIGQDDFEYPPGHTMRCNDWRLDLFEPS